MAMAHSVEARYPFLDMNLVEFARQIPPHLKVNQFSEKYIVKKIAASLVPPEIVQREKFAFVAPASVALLQHCAAWTNNLLSFERIKRDGYFNPHTVEHLKNLYTRPGFRLNIPFESDLLIVVLTFNLLLDVYDMPSLR